MFRNLRIAYSNVSIACSNMITAFTKLKVGDTVYQNWDTKQENPMQILGFGWSDSYAAREYSGIKVACASSDSGFDWVPYGTFYRVCKAYQKFQ